MRSETRSARVWVGAMSLLLAGCGSKSGTPGSGGAGGEAATGGAGGVTETGGAVGSGGRASGGATASGGALGDGSVGPSGDGSLGCGVSNAATGVLNAQTITVAGKARTYVLSVPKTYAPGTPMPLVFAWHGMGGSGSMARSYFRLETAAGNGAIFVYPDGLPVGDGSTGWELTATGIDVALFDALLAYVSDNYCIDRNRIFSTGHSFGGMFTNNLACHRGDILRAIAPVAGMPPFGRNVTCAGNVAAWVIHGENDATVDFTSGGIGTRDFWIGKNGCSTTLEPVATSPAGCVEYQGCQPDLPVAWCVHTQGHNWPTASGSGCGDGGVCFDAGAAIWTFFTRFQ